MLLLRVKGYCERRFFVGIFCFFLIFIFLILVVLNVVVKQKEQIVLTAFDHDEEYLPDSTIIDDYDQDDDNLPIPQSLPSDEEEVATVLKRSNNKTSKDIADHLLQKLLNRIGNKLGPIIVGGIGDSGTRGVRDILIHLGVQMLSEGFVNPLTKDSLIYSGHYWTTMSNGQQWLRSPSALYNAPIMHSHSLKYTEKDVSFDQWNCGRQYVAKMIMRSMSVSTQLLGDRPLEQWGFKHPRSALLLPFWKASLGSKFVFIHVIRDGKDIVEGENQKLFHDHCDRYYGKFCDKGKLRTRINFWADLNRDIFEFALEQLQAHQYIAIRIEDLVLGNVACFSRLASYLNLSQFEKEERIPLAIKSNEGHVNSYLGKKWTSAIKNEVEIQVEKDVYVHRDFDFWGYKQDKFELSIDCENLPWLLTMRKAKGPLPGDI